MRIGRGRHGGLGSAYAEGAGSVGGACGQAGCPLEMFSIKRSHLLCGLRPSGTGTQFCLASRSPGLSFSEGRNISLTCAILLRFPLTCLAGRHTVCSSPLPRPGNSALPPLLVLPYSRPNHVVVAGVGLCAGPATVSKAAEGPGHVECLF